MRALPYADPGVPDTRSRTRFLTWLARAQWRTLVVGAFFGVLWMVAQALMPWAIGHGIDGIIADDTGSTTRWALFVAGMGLIQALAGVMRHRASAAN